ncbi:helix-turn-helix transcriptional regulator [Nocardioides sp. NPDC000445]|uniref:helix-turn-helix domain-containing protein n=1 Tax=Nocardioides sp. NPDC000445 TaxID=3154257 RepID=UPI003317BB55
MAGIESIRARRAELNLTQQDAAKRAGTSLATWRRFENAASSKVALEGFRAETLQGFARALKVNSTGLHELVTQGTEPSTGSNRTTAIDLEAERAARDFNRAFTGAPLTAADAAALHLTVASSGFPPTVDGRYHPETSYDFEAYLRSESSIREVDLLCDLPDFVLTQVNNYWLIRMGERIMRIGIELEEGRIPKPQCLADRFAASIVISNTDVPEPGDLDDFYPGIQYASDVYGYDPDTDFPEDGSIDYEWMDRVAGALVCTEEDDEPRYTELILMNAYGQGVYDPTDPRHPLHWFDIDANRERCKEEIATLYLPEAEQRARTAQAMQRLSNLFGHREE